MSVSSKVSVDLPQTTACQVISRSSRLSASRKVSASSPIYRQSLRLLLPRCASFLERSYTQSFGSSYSLCLRRMASIPLCGIWNADLSPLPGIASQTLTAGHRPHTSTTLILLAVSMQLLQGTMFTDSCSMGRFRRLCFSRHSLVLYHQVEHEETRSHCHRLRHEPWCLVSNSVFLCGTVADHCQCWHHGHYQDPGAGQCYFPYRLCM